MSPYFPLPFAALALAVALPPMTDGLAPARSPDRYGLDGPPARVLELPKELREISGLAFDGAGRLYAHGDEDATVYRLDPASGQVLDAFALTAAAAQAGKTSEKGKKGKKGKKDDGGKAIRGDFEDIQLVGDRVWLVTSDGVLYAAPVAAADEASTATAGAAGGAVAATRYDTGLGRACEVEGLLHDPATRSLLLLCKQPRANAWQGQVVLAAWSLETQRLEPQPRLLVPYERFLPLTGARQFHGTAIARTPSGGYLLIAGPQIAWAEVTPAGQVVAGGRLDPKYHHQPEGLAFAPDRRLLVSDEAGSGKGEARISVYVAR